MLQVEEQVRKAEIRINQETIAAKTEVTRPEFETQLKEDEAGAEQEDELAWALRSHRSSR
jgi:hypothetical protein